MTGSAAFVTFGPGGAQLQAAPPLPLAALLIGRPATEAAELLPRLFNLCARAQGLAARLSLGLPPPDPAEAVAEVVRDHTARLCLILPRAFALPALALPADPASLLGAGLPGDAAALPGWRSPVAPLLAAVAAAFPPGTATCDPLPPPPHPLARGAYENSAAGRQSAHPLLRSVEAGQGRGPLWRLLGLLADLLAALQGRLPPPACADGIATAAAARGQYALQLTQAQGRITGLARRTPTDHLLAPGGALLQALSRLPAALRPLAPQLIALHDPCIPVALREVQHA